MCYRRIEVFNPNLKKWIGLCWGWNCQGPNEFAGTMMTKKEIYPIGLPGFDPIKHVNHKFFFTKEGWRIVGKHILARIKKQGLTYRVVHKKRWVKPALKHDLQAIIKVYKKDYSKLPFKEQS